MNKKYKVGYTTGVFDMFHIGHLNIIRRAKEQCEHLIVGVSTDEVVENYKHHRPVIPFEDRMAIVAACRYVDEVVAQTSMDKFAAWEHLRFDAMFHGSEWRGTDLYNDYESKFETVGVDVVFLPHTDGISSTILRERNGRQS